ncbi:dethiobiotin synthetase [Lewinella marina]|uniref:ATP-dependent dethiobiotin synthetase BioD n=1 Tax=Neolewinella marina TaxID=438751 RepID=A0A2G0CGY8_9BACT|nr:dethiobiotin synthase [Neolewinella marina]NJB86290.1 dethiobiotin synthetase [Neolewinella marina]PHK99239.1 dethiobiotin synthase [Neolewinella marina]
MSQPAYFVSGIGTEVGKTVASAYLQLALGADYWKPVQAGDLDFGDRDRVRQWTGLPADRYHPERYRLRTPASPHYAAHLDGLSIELDDFRLPEPTGRPLLVEGAGGLLVPLNETDCMIDLAARLGLPVILVSRHYLGSINHTLLSLEVLKGRGMELAGIVFSGGENPESERIITQLSGAPVLARLPELPQIDPTTLQGLLDAAPLALPSRSPQ